MTPEAQRIAIAEFLFPDYEWSSDGLYWYDPQTNNNGVGHDYLNDLNAMHEAEKVLGEFGTLIWRQYQSYISKGDIAVLCGVIPHATASQRAEAFLRTLGLWK